LVINDTRNISNWSVLTWHHVAITRQGRYVYLFQNGTKIRTYDCGSTLDIASANTEPLYIGHDTYNYGYSVKPFCWMDEIRIVKGVCAWTDDFTVRTTQY